MVMALFSCSGGNAGSPGVPAGDAEQAIAPEPPQNPSGDRNARQEPQGPALVQVRNNQSYLASLRSTLEAPGLPVFPRDVRHGMLSADLPGDPSFPARIQVIAAALEKGEAAPVLADPAMATLVQTGFMGHSAGPVRIMGTVARADGSIVTAIAWPGEDRRGEITVQKDQAGVWMVIDAWAREDVPAEGDDSERKYPDRNMRDIRERDWLD